MKTEWLQIYLENEISYFSHGFSKSHQEKIIFMWVKSPVNKIESLAAQRYIFISSRLKIKGLIRQH